MFGPTSIGNPLTILPSVPYAYKLPSEDVNKRSNIPSAFTSATETPDVMVLLKLTGKFSINTPAPFIA